MATYTRDGQTWETRSLRYSYYDGQPCKIIEMRGDYDSFCSDDTVLLQAQSLRDGWVRYWMTSSDPGERDSIADVAQAYL